MPKQITAAAVEGTRKRGRPCKKSGKVEDDLNIMGINDWSETIGNGGRLYWKPRFQQAVVLENNNNNYNKQ
jgi:hypothetical protein